MSVQNLVVLLNTTLDCNKIVCDLPGNWIAIPADSHNEDCNSLASPSAAVTDCHVLTSSVPWQTSPLCARPDRTVRGGPATVVSVLWGAAPAVNQKL